MTPQDFIPLLNHLWQSTLVTGCACLACATVLRTHSARVRFGVWLATSLKFLVPFALLANAGRDLATPSLLTPSQSHQLFDIIRTSSPLLAPVALSGPRAPQAPSTDYAFLLGALLIAWALGAAIVLSRWFIHWRAIRSLARDAHPAGDFRGIVILSSRRMRDLRIEPGVVGFWRQSILMPEGIETQLSATQLQTILEHEWQHVRRWDNLISAFHLIVQALFWFHPVVWLIGQRLTQEREIACDEAVLASAPPDDYAEGILSVCKFYWGPSHSPASGITSADLRARVELIMRNERPRELIGFRRWMLAATACAVIAAPTFVGWLTAQAVSDQQGNSFVGLATSAEKKFEVATIKENNSGSTQFQLGPPGRGQIAITNLNLAAIIAQSFRTNRTMMQGEPDWARSTNYDIVGKGPDPKATNPEVWEMMRSLLIERFHLKYHIEQRDTPVFNLTVAKGGPKLTLGENGLCKDEIKVGRNCGDLPGAPFGMMMYNMPIGALITGIGRRAGRPIVDRTNLPGRYDANITWLPEGAKLEELNLQDVPAEFRPQDMGLFEALEKQAGLKLEPANAPMPMLVVDSISKPDPN
jgi:uncharacterized protein (TIGR03435 family)